MDLVSASSILTSAINAAKMLKDFDKNFKDAEAKNLIADLISSLADLKMNFAELQEENTQLRKELREKEDVEEIREKLNLKDGVYFLNEKYKSYHAGPYCTRCLDADGKLIIAKKVWNHDNKYSCPYCKTLSTKMNLK